jgi:hypothetical protein
METGHFPYLVLSKNRNPNILRDLGIDVKKEVPLGESSFKKFV